MQIYAIYAMKSMQDNLCNLENLTPCIAALLDALPGAAEQLCLKIVIWLILPVVICLSQRLSHACLSIVIYSETANGSLKQL